jgi:hypothetical protein
MYFRDRIKVLRVNQDNFRAELRDRTIRPVASFVLAIHLKIKVFVIHGVHRDQIDDRKHILGRFRSHFQKYCWRVDLKKASRPFDF